MVEAGARVIYCKVSPSDLGWPVSGTRSLATSLRLDSLLWLGPERQEDIRKHFMSIFGCRAACDADVFADLDSPAEIQKARLLMAKGTAPERAMQHSAAAA